MVLGNKLALELLLVLEREGDLHLKDFKKHVPYHSRTIGEHAHLLASLGFVSRERDRGDQKFITIKLTPAGIELVKRVIECMRVIQEAERNEKEKLGIVKRMG